jgi:hypothetical protein
MGSNLTQLVASKPNPQEGLFLDLCGLRQLKYDGLHYIKRPLAAYRDPEDIRPGQFRE